MAALRLPCRTCVLSASPRLALDIFQARLARKAWTGDLGADILRWRADGAEKLHCASTNGGFRPKADFATFPRYD